MKEIRIIYQATHILSENIIKMNWNNKLETKIPEEAFNKFFQVLNYEFKMACSAKNVVNTVTKLPWYNGRINLILFSSRRMTLNFDTGNFILKKSERQNYINFE